GRHACGGQAFQIQAGFILQVGLLFGAQPQVRQIDLRQAAEVEFLYSRRHLGRRGGGDRGAPQLFRLARREVGGPAQPDGGRGNERRSLGFGDVERGEVERLRRGGSLQAAEIER